MAVINASGYRSYPALNQSKLKKIFIPNFYKKEDSKSYSFDKGSYIDYYVDNDIENLNKFIIEPNIKISESVKTFFIEFFNLYNSTGNILDSKDDLITHAMLTGLDKRLKEVALWDKIYKNKEYFEFLAVNMNKIYITHFDAEIAKSAKKDLEEIDNFKQIRFMSKVCLTGFYKDVEIKGELDRLYINDSKKTIYIRDIKTTADSYFDFWKSILKYRYDFQQSFYELLVELNLKELDLENYTFETSGFYVINTAYISPIKEKECRINAVKNYTLNGRTFLGIDKAIESYKWHTKNNLWDFPYDYYISGKIEKDNLNIIYEI